jgi:hypothetical protein
MENCNASQGFPLSKIRFSHFAAVHHFAKKRHFLYPFAAKCNLVYYNQDSNKPLQGVLMLKLLNQFKALPSPSNRLKLQNYLNKHPFAVCIASLEDVDFLKTHSFSI